MRATFSKMSECTAEDWQIILPQQLAYFQKLPDRILQHMELLTGDYGGFPVDRLQHCLQTAHRAAEAGEDDEYVICALLHDMGDTLGSTNHADVAAVILQPFVSEENHWMVKHHAIFQGYNFFQHSYGRADEVEVSGAAFTEHTNAGQQGIEAHIRAVPSGG